MRKIDLIEEKNVEKKCLNSIIDIIRLVLNAMIMDRLKNESTSGLVLGKKRPTNQKTNYTQVITDLLKLLDFDLN